MSIKSVKKIEEKENTNSRRLLFSNASLASILLAFASILYAIVLTEPGWKTINEGSTITNFTISWWVPLAICPFALLDFVMDYLPTKKNKFISIFALLPSFALIVSTLIALIIYFQMHGTGEGLVMLSRFFSGCAVILLSLTPFFLRLMELFNRPFYGEKKERGIFFSLFSLLLVFLFGAGTSVCYALQGIEGLETIFTLLGMIASLLLFFFGLYVAFGKGQEEKSGKVTLIALGAELAYCFVVLMIGVVRFSSSSGSSLHIFFWMIACGFGGILSGSCSFFYLGIDVLYGRETLKESEESVDATNL